MPRPRGQDLQEPAVRVLQRRPGNEVAGCRDENVGDVEVHPVGTAHLGRDDAMSLDASEDGAGLRFQVEVLASVRFCEGWTVLRPVDQVAGGRDGEAGDAAVPLRVRERRGPVLWLVEARILDSPGPLGLPLRVVLGIEYGRASACEAQAVLALPENDAQRQYEWPGGVEDPRVVEAEDRTF